MPACRQKIPAAFSQDNAEVAQRNIGFKPMRQVIVHVIHASVLSARHASSGMLRLEHPRRGVFRLPIGVQPC